MIGSREITFNRFYVLEFLQTVGTRIPEELSGEQAEIMVQLIDNLINQDDVTAGIEKLAREHGTGELSIFLFDIFDRIEDYPPTVAYDALLDIVEDFVNAVGVMLEEAETVESLKLVNADFTGEAIAPEAEITISPEIPVSEKEVPAEQAAKPVESLIATEEIPENVPFESFVTLEVEKMLVDFFGKIDQPVSGDDLHVFSNLVLAADELPAKGDVPHTLLKLMQVRQMLFPWRYELETKSTNLMVNLAENINKFAGLIAQLAQENDQIILESLKNDRISLPKPRYIREEIPAEPTTIDGLLSQYFSSEVEEHSEQIRHTLTQLTEKPDNKTLIKEFVEHFQSLNEISMIHGYSPIESFCSRMVTVINNGLKDNLIFNSETLGHFDQLFELLAVVEPLRDVRAETREASDLADLANTLAPQLMIPRPKRGSKENQKIEPADSAPETDVSQEETSEELQLEGSQAEIYSEPEISFDDEDAVFTILRDLILRSHTVLEKYFRDESQWQKAYNLLHIFSEDSRLIGKPEMQTVLNEFKAFTTKIQESVFPDTEDAVNFLLTQYENFMKSMSPGMKSADITSALGDYQPGPELIAGSNTIKLLQILSDIEVKNQKKFDQVLTQIAEGDAGSKEKQIRHFRRLSENLGIAGSSKHSAFPDYYVKLLESRDQIADLDKSILQELFHSYRLFVESLSSGGTGVDTGELVAVLDELFTTPEDQEIPDGKAIIEPPAQEETGPAEQAEGEEDLDEIFRQESGNSFDQIEKSLKVLNNDLANEEQYGILERNLHSLKSSARLMGYTDVADIAAPMEDLCENIHAGYYSPTQESLEIIQEGITLLKSMIKGEKTVDPQTFKSKIEDLKLPQVSEDEKDKTKTPSDEKPLFSDRDDEDADLLDIFKDEADQYIKVLETANKKLQKNPGDKKSLKELETASHSLKSAAKMLGFREIGQLGDVLEMAAEAMYKGEIPDSPSAQQQISKSIDFIKKLTAGEKADPSHVGEIISLLQPDKLKSYSDEEPQPQAEDEGDRETFLQEAADLLEKINSDLVKIEKKPEDPALLSNLYRNMHTLKGGAQIMQYSKIGTIAHRIEDFFEAARKGNKAINSDTMDPIFKAVDEIQAIVESIKKNGQESSDQYEEVLNAISEIQDIGEAEFKAPVIRQMEEKPGDQGDNGQDQTIKLTTQRLDHLMNMAAGLIVNKTQLNNYLESMKTIVNRIDKDRNRLRSTRSTIDTLIELNESRDPNSDQGGLNQAAEEFNEVISTLDGVSSEFYSITQHLEQNIREISQLTKQLHDDILQARMVPGEVLFNRFPRAVRDLARKQKKKINLMVEGESTELDRAMIETLTDPVMHLIRNAIDHGIELPKERKEKQKSEDGIVLLKALRDKNQIIIEVHDDGRGIDPDIIAEKAVALGLTDQKQVKKMREEEILGLIFTPGFSTAEKATDVSGRGVGLDVVATEIQKLNGDIRLNSTPDKGTIFRIRVPLTLAITQTMLVELDSEILAIQISAIDEAIEVNHADIVSENDLTYLKFRDQNLPLKNLANFLHYEEKERKPDKPSGLVILDGNIKYVLQVDAVLRREEIVVKSLGPELREVPYISGGTVLGDGSVVLILDIAAVTHKIEIEYADGGKDFSSLETARQVLSDKGQRKSSVKRSGPAKQKRSGKSKTIKQKKISGRKPIALIVDDSLSVRKFVSAVLERNNYATLLASDGPEALDKIRENDFDIIITDLEMPKMQGLDLIENIRSDNKYKDIPIIILTGKSGREHEEKGKQAGANAYIIKPFKEGDLVKTLEKFIVV